MNASNENEKGPAGQIDPFLAARVEGWKIIMGKSLLKQADGSTLPNEPNSHSFNGLRKHDASNGTESNANRSLGHPEE